MPDCKTVGGSRAADFGSRTDEREKLECSLGIAKPLPDGRRSGGFDLMMQPNAKQHEQIRSMSARVSPVSVGGCPSGSGAFVWS